jgi:hypothetical protein
VGAGVEVGEEVKLGSSRSFFSNAGELYTQEITVLCLCLLQCSFSWVCPAAIVGARRQMPSAKLNVLFLTSPIDSSIEGHHSSCAFATGADVQVAHQPADVELHGTLGDAQAVRDLLVGLTEHQGIRDGALSGRGR